MSERRSPSRHESTSRFHDLLKNLASEHDREIEELNHKVSQLTLAVKSMGASSPTSSQEEVHKPKVNGQIGLAQVELSQSSDVNDMTEKPRVFDIPKVFHSEGSDVDKGHAVEKDAKGTFLENSQRRKSVTWHNKEENGEESLADKLENLQRQRQSPDRRPSIHRGRSAVSSHSLLERDSSLAPSVAESCIVLPGGCDIPPKSSVSMTSNATFAMSSNCVSSIGNDLEPPSTSASMLSSMLKIGSGSRRASRVHTMFSTAKSNLGGVNEESPSSPSWKKSATSFLFKGPESKKILDSPKSDTPVETAPMAELRMNPVWTVDPKDLEKMEVESKLDCLTSSRSVAHRHLQPSRMLLTRRPSHLRLGSFPESFAQLRSQWECSRMIASPSSVKRLVWELLGFAFLLYDLIMIPMQVYSPEETAAVVVIQLCTTVFWSADIVASFLVGYHTKGFIEYRFKKIAIRYMKSWFFLDFSIIALDVTFTILSRSQDSVSSFRKFSRGLRGLRLLRIMKFHMLMSEMIQRVHSEYKRTMIGILRIVLFIILVNHFIACGFYAIGLRESGQKSWIAVNFDGTDGVMYRYWTSLHWSLTQFTPASMEVVPRNSMERFYTVVVMFLALITFSSFISSITNAMTRLRNINENQIQYEAILHRYLQEHNISRKVVYRILALITERKQLTGQRVLTKEEDVDLFKTLPESLKSEVRYEAYYPILQVHPFFFEYHTAYAGSMKGICRTSLHERSLIVREELFGTGTAVQHMVFIRGGRLKFTYPEEALRENVEAFLENGSWICEFALWAKCPETCGPFTAALATDLVLLSADKFISRVQRYPWAKKMVVNYAHQFMEFVKNLAKDSPWDVMLCHSKDLLQDFAHEAFGIEEFVAPDQFPIRKRGSLKGLIAVASDNIFRSISADSKDTQESVMSSKISKGTAASIPRSYLKENASRDLESVVP